VSYTLEHPSSLYASSSQGQRLRPLVQHCLRLIEGTVLDSLELSRIRSSFLRLLYEWG
jgi:hypothetical protein